MTDEVETKLEQLFERYGDKVMNAASRAEVEALVREYASACLGELDDSEVELRERFLDMAARA